MIVASIVATSFSSVPFRANASPEHTISVFPARFPGLVR
jgi:hypothetical protein